MTQKHKPPESRLPATTPNAPVWVRVFVGAVMGAAVFLALWALGLTANRDTDVGQFASQGWGGQYAAVIVSNRIRALWHGALMMGCAGVALWMLLLKSGASSRPPSGNDGSVAPSGRARKIIGALLILVVLDAWLLSRDYIKTMPMSSVAENPVIALLKKDAEHRVVLLSQDGFYGSWLTFLFPYHGISALNTTQAPRMPEDYKNFLGTLGRNPVRLWQLSAIGHVLAPAQVWAQMKKDPELGDAFSLVYSYNVSPEGAGVSIIPATMQYPGQHVVLRLNRPAPRFALIGSFEVMPDDEALKCLGSPSYPLFEKVLIPPSFRDELPSDLTTEQRGSAGTCRMVNYRSGRIELDVLADHAGVLRISEKYDAGWQATVDGRRAPVYRVDYIVQGVPVAAGQHRVVMTYGASPWALRTQLAGFAIVFVAMISLVVRRLMLRH